MKEVDFVIGNEEKLSSNTWSNFNQEGELSKKSQRIQVNDIMDVKRINPWQVKNLTGRSRAYVQIQNGCDHRCTFCVIPFGRGNSRSVSVDKILGQIQKLVDNEIQDPFLQQISRTRSEAGGMNLKPTPYPKKLKRTLGL